MRGSPRGFWVVEVTWNRVDLQVLQFLGTSDFRGKTFTELPRDDGHQGRWALGTMGIGEDGHRG